jgi:rhodanese-related sulfurtransferase
MIKNIDTAKLLEIFSLDDIQQRDDIVVVDVREPQEYAHEHIEQSINVPLSKLGTLGSENYKDKIAIFHCRSGKRTSLNENAMDSTPFKEKYCLAGGIVEWKETSMPTISEYSAPVDVMRQVQLIVGCMILLGVGLSYLISVYFIILTIFAGLGLLVAGFTGFCGMAEVLKFLPWNQSRKHS